MIVCLCMGISDSEIKKCAKEGATSLELIEESCGAGSCCQACHPEIQLLLEEDSGVSYEEGLSHYQSLK